MTREEFNELYPKVRQFLIDHAAEIQEYATKDFARVDEVELGEPADSFDFSGFTEAERKSLIGFMEYLKEKRNGKEQIKTQDKN